MRKMVVQKAIDYIDDHIGEVLHVDQISKHVGYSKYYLHRLFYVYTGMTIMEYVRNRKLEYALRDLQTDTAIIDIAVKYGYRSHRSFSRAFIGKYGKPPSIFRHNTSHLPSKMIINEIGGIQILKYLSETKVVNKNKLYVLAHAIISPTPEDDVIDFMTRYQQEYQLEVITEYGFEIEVSEEDNKLGLRGYEYWLVLDKTLFDVFDGDGVEKKIIPESKYLSLTITDPFADPFERIPNGWKKLISVIEAHYMFNDKPGLYCLEEKVETKNDTVMHIYTPIK